ncbi:MAG: OB-fold domain-containing protein [Dehalococcoidia bacterium]|nr:OB-fold domain-containing protein [Dehalococcoidia bacterium]
MANSRSSEAECQPAKKETRVLEGLFHLPASPGEQPYLIGSKCSVCGLVVFPKRTFCPVCEIDKPMDEVPLSRKGKLVSYTCARVPSEGMTAPYLMGTIDLPEGPRFISLIAGEQDINALKIGMEVELLIDKIAEEEGHDLIGYKFQPVKKGQGGDHK